MILRPYARKARRAPVVLRAVTAIVLCTLTFACRSPQDSHAPTEAGNSSVKSISASAQQADAFKITPFTGNATAAKSITAASNYSDLLQQYSPAQQTTIKDWYARYAMGSLDFDSSAQWLWMRQHGYPTPDDVLRAATMSTAQLRNLAVSGDTKANFFYLARLLDGKNNAQVSGVSGTQDRNEILLLSEMSESMSRALASGSAFAGYMFASYYVTLHDVDAVGVGRAAGLTWADSFGDSRLVFTNRGMTMGFPGVSGVRTAEAYFDMFAAAARANSYFLNARQGQGDLSIPLK